MHASRSAPQGKVASKIAAFGRVRRSYRNWFHVLWTYARGRDPAFVELRNGTRLAFGTPPAFDRWLAVQMMPRLIDAGWVAEPNDATHAFLSHPGEKVRFRCRFLGRWSDIIPLVEVYVERVYGEDFSGKVVLDIGMANGDSSVFFAQHGAQQVYAVEPIPESFALAQENIRLNHLEGRITPINAAMLARRGETKMQIASAAPNRSTVRPDEDRTAVAFDQVLAVPTLGIADLLREHSIDRVDFVKMDCEGCEYAVLGAVTSEELARIRSIALEFHDGPKDLPKLFESNGFAVEVHGTSVGYLLAHRA
ncbi:MAG: FkbM family methyltransferase [Thermoplasmata archaeon]|nr:FkbM family methyltransferase [Thermoplasmata archaeon]MCI4353759.1 FkbM family methyltransferase [Thermoplasmata archaeon]